MEIGWEASVEGGAVQGGLNYETNPIFLQKTQWKCISVQKNEPNFRAKKAVLSDQIKVNPTKSNQN